MRWNDRIGRRIKLSDLHILVAVAQSGSMAKAASLLAISHPVISRSISTLEHTLGVRLLERNPRGVELTAYGRAMLSRSNAAFDELRQGVGIPAWCFMSRPRVPMHCYATWRSAALTCWC
jgi:DNA-binding transcriptional LysR family regulator